MPFDDSLILLSTSANTTWSVFKNPRTNRQLQSRDFLACEKAIDPHTNDVSQEDHKNSSVHSALLAVA